MNLEYQSETMLGKDELKKVELIIKQLWDNKESADFQIPVDWKNWNLPDYPIIIKKPMDLGTIKKNIKAIKYETVEAILLDIQLIWDNCHLYNAPGSWIYKVGSNLEIQFQKLIKNQFPLLQLNKKEENNLQDSQDEDIDEVNYDEKLEFSQRIKKLTEPQLGEIVCFIKQKAPQAFNEVSKTQCQILVEQISKEVFQDLKEFKIIIFRLMDQLLYDNRPQESVQKQVKL